MDGEVAISSSVVKFAPPMPHANTAAGRSLTSCAASMAVCRSVLPGAASTDCSPSEMNSTILAAFVRVPPPSSAKSSRARSKPSEIEVLLEVSILSIPALIRTGSYDHGTRVVASLAKDTTEKRAASAPRENMCTSSLAKAFIPLGPSNEPSGRGFFIEPLLSSTREMSTWYAHGGGEGGSGRGASFGG